MTQKKWIILTAILLLLAIGASLCAVNFYTRWMSASATHFNDLQESFEKEQKIQEVNEKNDRLTEEINTLREELYQHKYKTYTNTRFHFTCKYPADFTKVIYEHETSTILGHYAQEDEYMLITSGPDEGKSPESAMNDIIDISSSYTVDFKVCNDNYYSLRLKSSRNSYLHYVTYFKDGYSYGFAISFPSEKLEFYDTVAQEIYEEFIKQF